MTAMPGIFGKLAGHPRAEELSGEVHRMLQRYATEVVATYRLCPFLHNVESGLGDVGIMLDPEPDIASAEHAIRTLGGSVLHLVYPLTTFGASPFERFGSKLAQGLKNSFPDPLVHATFHPELTGGMENAHRLIGKLRNAPDPFVQLIPPGMMQGGTVLAERPEDAPAAGESRADAMYRRMMGGDVDRALALIAELGKEREARYGELARAIAASSPLTP